MDVEKLWKGFHSVLLRFPITGARTQPMTIRGHSRGYRDSGSGYFEIAHFPTYNINFFSKSVFSTYAYLFIYCTIQKHGNGHACFGIRRPPTLLGQYMTSSHHNVDSSPPLPAPGILHKQWIKIIHYIQHILCHSRYKDLLDKQHAANSVAELTWYMP